MNYLLQTRFLEFPEQSPTSVLLAITLFIGFIAVLSLAGILTARSRDPRRFSRFSFRRKARSYGLNRQQVLILEHTVASSPLARPDHLFENQALLEGIMKKAVHAIEVSPSLSESEKENRKALFYQIRQQIDRETERRNTLTSSSQIKLNQDVELILPDRVRVSTHVNRTPSKYLGVGIPVNRAGREVRPPKGTALKAVFSRNGRDLYSFETRVLGYTQGKGSMSLVLAHSDRLVHEQKRRFPRKNISSPAYFYPIQIVETGTGRNAGRQAMIDTRRKALGSLLDISAGGCSMRAPAGLEKGQLVKLEFNAGREKNVAVLGKIIQVRKEPGRGTVMHIMFTKISQRNANLIQEYVYSLSRS